MASTVLASQRNVLFTWFLCACVCAVGWDDSYAVPRNMAELTEQQRKGEDASVVECTLEDEALLD